MGIFKNLEKYEDEDIYDYIKKILSGVYTKGGSGSGQQGPPGQQGQPGVGFKLISDGDYDLDGKKLTNIKDGEDDQDVLSKKQILELLILKVEKTYLDRMFTLDGNFTKSTTFINMNNKYLYNLKDPVSDSHSVNLRYLKSFTCRKLDIDNKIASTTFDASLVVLTGN